MSVEPANSRARLVPIVLAQSIGLLCGIIGVKITTRLVVPADYGMYGVFLTFTPLGMWVVHAGLVKFVYRYWAEAPDRLGFWRTVRHATIRKLPWLALACAGAAVAIAQSKAVGVFAILFVAATALSFGALGQAALQASREHWRDVVVAGTGSLTRTFAPIILYVLTGGAVAALFAGFAFHALTLATAARLSVRLQWRKPVVEAQPRPAIHAVYEGPLFIVLALAGWTLTGLNRWLVAAFFGAAAAGQFTLASNLAAIAPSVLITVFVQYFQPSLFAAECASPAARQRLARRVDRLAAGYWLCVLGAVAAVHLVSPMLVGILISPGYQPALRLILPAGGFAIALTTASIFDVMLLAGKCEKACGPVDLSSAALLVASGLLAASCGSVWFERWLLVTPALPWLVNRPLARHFLFKAA
jgi:O-antigen/teichoic acid export membrane protein